MEGNVVNNLCSLPATDLNFTSELNRATAYQIKQAIEKMKLKPVKESWKTEGLRKKIRMESMSLRSI